MVEIGERAPDVELVDTERKPVKISDFKGKRTVLAFYPGAFTGVCTKEMCTFRDSLSKFNSLDANVVGISVDRPFGVALENFAGLRGYTSAKRAVFILDKEGVVKFKWVSDNPGIEPNYEQVLSELSKVQ